MEKKGYSLLHVIIIIVVTSIISGITTGVIFTKSTTNNKGVSYSELIVDENVQDFLDVYAEIISEYYKDVDKEQMIKNAINGMMKYLDESYTTYLDENAANSLKEQLNGTYEGIGITFKDGKVLNVLKDSPAEEAGILSGDVIASVNGVNVEGSSSDNILALIKANAENVILNVYRNGVPLTFSMKMEILNVPSVTYNIIEGTQIGYLEMSVFSSTLDEEVEYAISKLKESGLKGYILDLRNNTGGYLDQAYSTASLFLENGKVIYTLETKDGSETFVDKDENKENLPIIILVNKSTASAAEILAAALKDSYGATIVGTTTFGKGKVQHTYSLNDGGLVKYTASKWLRPNGTCIDTIGITPDHMIENEYIYDETDPENPIVIDVIDHQLSKAIELLNY
ncbi:MAG: S41 family peptidase [Firmicutes bacterium]|nr:S41 family peptidase [Bacillota bacterium]